MQYSILTLKKFFLKGQARSQLAKWNIASNFLIKIINIALILILVPLTISVVDAYHYGIWITLSSILGWVLFFDVGLGNGLKNKLTEALAKGDILLARSYISTTYILLSFVVLSIATIGLFTFPFINWATLLNIKPEFNSEVYYLATIVLVSLCLQFLLQLIVVIFISRQESYMQALISMLANLLILLLIVIIKIAGYKSLILVGIAYTLAPVLTLTSLSFYFFSGKFKNLAPTKDLFEKSYAKDILSLGFKFFVIQIAFLVQYELISILLARHFGPEKVTDYYIIYKYFGVINMLFTIIIAPFWSHFTDAFVKEDYKWIKNMINKLLKVWVGLCVIGLFMLLIWEFIFGIWIGNKASFDNVMSFWVMIYFLSYTFGNIFTMFLNGSGKIHLQLITYIITPGVFLILVHYLSPLLGPSGIIIAAILCNIYGLVIAPYQYYLLINRRATGIWNK